MHSRRITALGVLAITVAMFCHGELVVNRVTGQETEEATSREHSFSFDLSQLEQPEPDRRREVCAEIRDEHAAMVRHLESIVKSAGQPESGSTKALAAQLLGEWHALETVPTLAMEMKYHAPGYTVIASLLDFDQYPCAKAIRDMGPSALRPFIEWILKRKAPLDKEEVRIASHIVYAILDYDKQKALDFLRTVEASHPESPHFAPVLQYIKERIPDRERAN